MEKCITVNCNKLADRSILGTPFCLECYFHSRSDIVEKNRNAARAEHTDRANIIRLVNKHKPFETEMMNLLNEEIPELGLTLSPDDTCKWDLENGRGLMIDIEQGSWDRDQTFSFPKHPNYTMNLLARKSFRGFYCKFDSNKKSGFIVLGSKITEWVREGRLVAVKNLPSESKRKDFNGTSCLVYKLTMKDRQDLEKMGALLMVSNGNYKGIKSFFKNNGFE